MVGMGLAAINELNGADFASDTAQSFRILKQKVGALVGAGAAGQAEGEKLGIKLHSQGLGDLVEQIRLGFTVGPLNAGGRNADGVTQIAVVVSPPVNKGVAELPECRR